MNYKSVSKIIQKYIDRLPVKRTEKIYYQNLLGVRKSGIDYNMNYLELSEYSKCYNNEIYFIEEYLGVKLHDFQIELVDHYKNNRFQIFLASRQTGTESLLMMLFLHTLIFNMNKNIFLFDYISKNNLKNLNIIKYYYKKLPFFMQAGILIWNNKCISMDNGNYLTIRKYSKTVAISHNIDIIFMNNFSNYTNKKEFFYTITPASTLSKTSKLIIKSFFNGNDLFCELVNNSERLIGDPLKSVFKIYRIYWWQIPGRDINWKNEEIKKIGQDIFDQEYDFKIKSK